MRKTKGKSFLGTLCLLTSIAFAGNAQTVDVKLKSISVQQPIVQEVNTGVAVTVDIENIGTENLPKGYVLFYTSPDQELSESDTRLGYERFDALNVGESLTANFSAGGIYVNNGDYILAVVGTFSAETDTLNNQKVFGPVTVTRAALPDFINQNVTGNSNLCVGGAFTVSTSMTVMWGAEDNITGKVGYYLSADQTYDSGDRYIGNTSFDLDLGNSKLYDFNASSSGELLMPSTVPAGNYYLISKIDYQDLQEEQDEANNISMIPVSLTIPVASLNITSPVNDATYQSSSGILIAANVLIAPSVASVDRVEFYDGGMLLATDYSSPYEYLWMTAPAGTHNIVARAFSNSTMVVGVSHVTVSVTNYNIAPNIRFTSMYSDIYWVGPLDLLLETDANDINGTIAKVEFYEGTTLLGTVEEFPYTFNWQNVQIGSYHVSAVAYDNEGATTSTGIYNVFVEEKNVDDLEIGSMAREQNVVTGEKVSFTSVITNTGVSYSSGGTISYYLSTDNTYENSDLFLGKAKFGRVGVGADSVISVTLTIPSGVADGTYYIIAVIDDQTTSEASNARQAELTVNYLEIRLSRTTAFEDLEKEAKAFQLFPNPTSGIFSVQAGDKATLVIRSVLGVEVLRQEVAGDAQVDISNFVSGIYQAEVSGSDKRQSFKLIKE